MNDLALGYGFIQVEQGVGHENQEANSTSSSRMKVSADAVEMISLAPFGLA